MAPYRICKDQQIRWANKRGLELQGSKGPRGERAYTISIDDNLFQPLSPEATSELQNGDGNELGNDNGFPSKMQAVHSSAALSANVFEYWRSRNAQEPLAAALGLLSHEIASLQFEVKRPVIDDAKRHGFKTAPNLDVVLTGVSGDNAMEVGIECKFTEPYSGRGAIGYVADAYLRREELWNQLPSCRVLAEELKIGNDRFSFLHAAQLLKHILGLKHQNGLKHFHLIYLWFDVSHPEIDVHRQEISEFGDLVAKDGVTFQAMTFQEVIGKLAQQRNGHEAYVDYLVSRYLD